MSRQGIEVRLSIIEPATIALQHIYKQSYSTTHVGAHPPTKTLDAPDGGANIFWQPHNGPICVHQVYNQAILAIQNYSQ